MAWNPFRRSASKKPVGSGSEEPDSDLASQIQSFTDCEAVSKKVYKDAKVLMADNTNVAKAQQKIAQDMTGYAQSLSHPELVQTIDSLNNCVTQQAEYYTELSGNNRTTFVEPLRKFHSSFQMVQSAIKRRDQSSQDLQRYLVRREKYLEKGMYQQSGKFDANERYLNLARADFQRRNDKITEELPKFYQARSEYFEPCYQAYVQSMVNFYGQSSQSYAEAMVGDICTNNVVDDTENNNVDAPHKQCDSTAARQQHKTDEIARRLAEIKALSIVD